MRSSIYMVPVNTGHVERAVWLVVSDVVGRTAVARTFDAREGPRLVGQLTP